MVWVAIIKLLAVGHALTGSVRARFAPGLSLFVSLGTTVALPGAAAFVGDASWLASDVLWIWALPPLVSAIVVGIATRSAFRELDRTMAGSAREDALTSAAYGLLANALLDGAIFVLVVAGTALMSDSAF